MKEKETAASGGTDPQSNADSQGAEPNFLYHPALSPGTLESAGVRLKDYADQHDLLTFPHFDAHGTPIDHRSYYLPQSLANGSHWLTSAEPGAIYCPPDGLGE